MRDPNETAANAVAALSEAAHKVEELGLNRMGNDLMEMTGRVLEQIPEADCEEVQAILRRRERAEDYVTSPEGINWPEAKALDSMTTVDGQTAVLVRMRNNRDGRETKGVILFDESNRPGFYSAAPEQFGWDRDGRRWMAGEWVVATRDIDGGPDQPMISEGTRGRVFRVGASLRTTYGLRVAFGADEVKMNVPYDTVRPVEAETA